MSEFPPAIPKDSYVKSQAEKLGLGEQKVATAIVKPRCYLAGPIRGDAGYKGKFTRAKHKLEKMGWDVASPVDIMIARKQTPGVPEDDRAGMAQDIAELVNCSCVMLMTGWQQSRGARAEVAVADSLDIPSYLVGEWPSA